MWECPECRTALAWGETIMCPRCGRRYDSVRGYIDFTSSISDATLPAFQDSLAEMQPHVESELRAGRRLASEWLAPILQAHGIMPRSRILSVGCGVGEDMVALRDVGYETYGIDLGFRVLAWERLQRDPRHFAVADGLRLPFQNRTIDAIVSFGVIEHIGAMGDSCQLHADWRRMREVFCAELARVAKRAVIISTPNKAFPIDFQHRVSATTLARYVGDRTGWYFHAPWTAFLLSYRDLDMLFGTVGVGQTTPLPLADYFGFNIRYSRPYLKPLLPLMRAYLRLIDRLPVPLRKSCLNPYVLALTSIPELPVP